MDRMLDRKAVQTMEILKNKKAGSMILMGEEKKGMLAMAMELAAAWLGTELSQLSCNPDFKLLEAENGILCTEQAETIQRMAYYIPQCEKAVCIVTDAETMTAELQNKLLKVLEDGEDRLAVIFVTAKPLLETITSRCFSVVFHRISLEELHSSVPHPSLAALLACEGSPERYDRIAQDTLYLQYLEGFWQMFSTIKERAQVKYVLQLTNALKEKDAEYLPDHFEDWQLRGFLSMLGQAFWYLILKNFDIAVPPWMRLGNLSEIYSMREALRLYQKSEESLERMKRKGQFTKNDFFEFLMEVVPLD